MPLLLHQICAKIPPVHKALQAAYFPPGYKFYFHSIDAAKYNARTQAHDKLEGLLIVSPLGKRCYSVESMMNSCKSLSSLDISPQKFYEYVGIELTDAERELLRLTYGERKQRPTHSQNILAVKPKDCRQCLPSLKELKDKGCMDCPPCHREPCGRCDPCTNGGDLCLKKVCHRVSHAYFPFSY